MSKTAIERFTEKYDLDPATGCWVWRAALDKGGYGRMWFEGRPRRAHRVAWTLHVGDIAYDLHLDHLCRNRACVNPAHLEPVTLRENVLRGEGACAKNARKTHCKRGHEFDERNTRVIASGRVCRECSRLATIAYQTARKSA